jgi:hypothetical protein
VNFQDAYAQMSDDELLTIAASRADLVPEATLALDSEMARRELTNQDVRAKKREVERLDIQEARRHRPSRKASKYFVSKMNGWMLLLLAVGVPALVLTLLFTHLVPEEWCFPILEVCMGAVIAVSVVQPWLRQTVSFWISLVVSCAVQLVIGYWISVHLAPQTGGELKGGAVLSIVPGYAAGIGLYRLLQKLELTSDPLSKTL